MKILKKIGLYILMFNMFITFSAVGLIVPVMPTYLKTFGAAGQASRLYHCDYCLCPVFFSPVAGNLSDRHGRKNLIIFGLFVNGISQIAFGLSTELWMLICLQILYWFRFSLYRASSYGLCGGSYNK